MNNLVCSYKEGSSKYSSVGQEDEGFFPQLKGSMSQQLAKSRSRSQGSGQSLQMRETPSWTETVKVPTTDNIQDQEENI